MAGATLAGRLLELVGTKGRKPISSGLGLCTQKAVHSLLLVRKDEADMPRQKDETLSIRTSAEVKQLLRLAAEREHRSVASMMEVLILSYAQAHGLRAEASPKEGTIKRKKARDGAH